MSSLYTGSTWSVSIYDENNTLKNEAWSGSYNNPKDKFSNPQIFSAKIKDNVIHIIFNSNIQIDSIK